MALGGIMDGNMFEGIDYLLKTMFITCLVSVPLGLWKLVEIIIWVINHVEIGIK